MYALTIHGGAGIIQPGDISQEEENAYHKGLQDALQTGYQILAAQGSALDAVEAAVCKLEDNALFNAGRGAVFTNEGTHELEASVMCGHTLNAGAACGLKHVKNPVSLARAIMEKSEYVFLSGEGAEQFAMEHNLELALEDYFFTHERYQELREKQTKEWDKAHAKADDSPVTGKSKGTVGAVALDVHRNLAAATSTGGLTNKKSGRIGDTPMIGCGTYAHNACCGVSCTGDGEFLIRTVAAHTVYSLMAYKGMSVQEACDYLIHHILQAVQGEGGLIAIDCQGNIGQSYNSPSMHRGSIQADGSWFTAVFENKRYTNNKKVVY
jgi:beta-aspartyl-peptidase (threonine type)